MDNIWTTLLGSGVSSSIVILAFLLYTFIKKKQDSSKQTKNTASNNVNITTGRTDSIHILNEEIRDIRNTIDEVSKTINDLSWSIKKLSIAMNYYVSNNGVSSEVKEHFKNILEGDK